MRHDAGFESAEFFNEGLAALSPIAGYYHIAGGPLQLKMPRPAARCRLKNCV